MTIDTATDVAALEPLGHAEAMDLQTVELERAIRLLRSLHPEDWARPTDCPDWDVRRMWLHVLGACEGAASMRENVHQMRVARRRRKERGLSLEAGLSSTQVDERVHLEPAELVDRLAAIAPRAVAARRRLPRPVRAVKLAVDAPVVEKWSLGYLSDVIYLRDLWMRRVDTVRATGGVLELTAEHDGRIVADVVAEWCRRHGEPCTLELTGPAGGTHGSAGDGTAPFAQDAVEFCRLLAGRGEATGLLATVVPF